MLGAEAIAPGETGLVRLHLPVAVPLLPGDRYVLREWGRQETVGGGEVLDVAPVAPASKAHPDRSVDRVVAERGWVEVDRARAPDRRAPGADDRPLGGGPRRGRRGARPASRRRSTRRARSGSTWRPSTTGPGPCSPRSPTWSSTAAGPGRAAAADPLAGHPYLAALDAEPFAPPPPDGVDRAELRELVRRGLVVAQDGVWFSAGAVERAGRLVADLLAAHPEGVTMSDLRVRVRQHPHATPCRWWRCSTGRA